MKNKNITKIVWIYIENLYKSMDNLQLYFNLKSSNNIFLKSISKIKFFNLKYNLYIDKQIQDLERFYFSKIQERELYMSSLFWGVLAKNKLVKYLANYINIKLEIAKSSNEFFLKNIKKIKQKFLWKKTIKNILLVDLNRNRFFDSFVVQILAIYCQILWIKLDYLAIKDKWAYNFDSYNIHQNNAILKQFWNKLKFQEVSFWDLDSYDLVIFNDVYYKEKYNYSSYLHNEIIREKILMLSKKSKNLIIKFFDNENYDGLENSNSFVYNRYNKIFFSKIISDINKKQDKKYIYDIMISWWIWQRDFNFIVNLVKNFPNFKFLILNSLPTEIQELNNMFFWYKNVKIIFTWCSYNNFYKYLNLSKIYLNCINPKVESHWMTWILCPLSSSSVIVSYSNSYYKNFINDWIDWFLYENNEKCIELLRLLLNWTAESENLLNSVRKERYDRFIKQESIEDILEKYLISK